MQNRAAFIHSPEIERLRYPADCPFKTERAGITKRLLQSMGLFVGEGRREIAPVPATRDEALLFHTPEYLDTLQRASAGDLRFADLHLGLGAPETPIFREMYDYAMLAAGASLTGARLLLSRQADIVFNPSGGFHHAFASKAAGFCYINDMALACRMLRDAGMRVFCLDLDAHHGDATQHAFYGDPAVMTVSFHESGKTLFPWGGFEQEIGEGQGIGYNVNVSLPAGSDDRAFHFAFERIVPPLLDAFKPDVIVLEIGMDILAGDPLTHLKMTNNAIADALPAILATGKPLLATGGGGYHPQNTARGWALAWTVLCGLEATTDGLAGMGGVFLGSAEWAPGLRDMHSYAQQQDQEKILQELAGSVRSIEKNVFPIHGISQA